ncbi:MAG: hypothetical protein WD200_04480 [Candidatus Andersenbacteria bacterium]
METSKTVAVKRRPFHETVVDAINACDVETFLCLTELIKITKIPKGHDEIISAWEGRREQLVFPDGYRGVVADLLEQKEEAAAKEVAKQEAEPISSPS